jgi:hypothetical protein
MSLHKYHVIATPKTNLPGGSVMTANVIQIANPKRQAKQMLTLADLRRSK